MTTPPFVTTPPFERTTCACPDCIGCCTSQPGALIPGDLERIAAYLRVPVRVAAVKFWASPGALLMNSATRETARVGTITPRLIRGRCIFLDPADRCTIHPVAPFGCSHFDTHMAAEAAQPRSVYAVRQQADPAYQSLRRTLAVATSYRPRTY